MTRNQLQYHANMENIRHNRTTEAETMRSNLEKERQGRATISETERSNRVRETETNRSNIANEALKGRSISEDERHNLAMETHNTAVLKEQQRHNKHTEVAGYIGAAGQAMRGVGSLVSSFNPAAGAVNAASQAVSQARTQPAPFPNEYV